MERVTLRLPRGRALSSEDGCEFLTDGGTGTLDESHPLNRRPLRLWEGLPVGTGHIDGGHLASAHLDDLIPDGCFSGSHLEEEHLFPAALLEWSAPPASFGARRYAARFSDAASNRTTAAVPRTHVFNTAPRQAESLTKTAFDSSTRRLTFTLQPASD